MPPSMVPPSMALPQETWDLVTGYLSPATAVELMKLMDRERQPYDIVWDRIFEKEEWANKAYDEHEANIVMFGTDLDKLKDSSAQLHIVLAINDRSGDVQYEKQLLESSLKCPSKLEKLDLTMSSFQVPEIDGDDFSYLFSTHENGLQTKYCYWGDPEKKIRTLNSENILGIDGPLRNVRELKPIFLLDLEPPIHSFPSYFPSIRAGRTPVCKTEQFIFRFFGGVSFDEGIVPLVDVLRKPGESEVKSLFAGFTFLNPEHSKLDREETNWRQLAKVQY
jgi:hypothetical protein